MIVFMVAFTYGSFRFGDIGNDLTALVVFCLMAVSPLAVWRYCLKRSKAWLRSERSAF
ncbi:hypothetical protein SAMN05192583_1204 [Sphingomonas gellani]|uniref:Uncharacterized protein n=2 Tax=Sphingomonas gellani TaxID=1166340 RepID=A0A1H8B6N6_9SPHN|nr:hypothetical protein SAMN05192583_1204 [Sphingomonas gellani]